MKAIGRFSALTYLALAVLAAACGGGAWAQGSRPSCLGSRDLTSPDGALIVHVMRTGRGGCGESRIEILDADGHLRADIDYTSSDGAHGAGIVLAQWSADSRYFVYSLADTGDGRPAKYRIDFYRSDTNRVRPITTLQPGLVIAQPEFALGEGDMIEISAKSGSVQLHLGGH